MKYFLALVALSFSLWATAQNKDLRNIYASDMSADAKIAAVKKQVKPGKLSELDLFAYDAIMMGSREEVSGELITRMWKTEGMTPSMFVNMDTMYPGLSDWYADLATKDNQTLFKFAAEPARPIGFADVVQVPVNVSKRNALELAHLITVQIQTELYKSTDLVIDKAFARLGDLYASLSDSLKLQLARDGYVDFWQEQRAAYAKKYASKTCICAPKQVQFETFRECGVNQLHLNATTSGMDEPTRLLIKLYDGDLSIADRANELRLTSYTEAKTEIPKEIIFLNLAVQNHQKLNSQWKINLLSMWDAAERLNMNGYLKSVGFSREDLANLEAYYSCALGARALSPEPVLETKTVTPPAKADSSKLLLSPAKPATGSPMDRKMVMRTPTPTETIIKKTNPKPAFSMEKLRSEVDSLVQNEIHNHEKSNACAETQAINDTVLEIILRGCGNGAGTFQVKQTNLPLAGEFFNYISNVVADELNKLSKSINGRYRVTVIGTADTLKYNDNQGLADARASFVKENLGRKMLEGVGGIGNVETIGLTEQSERKVTLRITITKQS